MIAYGMLYAVAVALPILLAALACSAALRRYGRPERGVWLAALGLALTLPAVFLISAFGGTSLGVSGTLAEAGLPSMASGTIPETGVLGLPTVVAVSVEPAGLGLDEVLVLAWLLVSVVLVLRWAVAAYRLAKVGASWRAGIVDGVRVWLTSDLGPAVSGIFRTRILVPGWLVSLPQEQRSLVLLHEEEHVRAKDPMLMAVSRIARIMAPWNPIVWLISSRLLHAVELDCDRRVLGLHPDVETYGGTLLAVSARDSGPLVAAAAFAESEVPLRRRIIAMTTPRRTVSVLGVLTVLSLGVVLLIGSGEVPVPITLEPERPESRDEIFYISVERDGSVYVNDELYPMEDVSEVVALLKGASEGPPFVSIVADQEVPYQVMDQLQQELMATGVVLVVFEAVDSLTLQSSRIDLPALLDRGLAMVLGAVRVVYEALESLAVRSPPDDVDALVDRGLAHVLPALRYSPGQGEPRRLQDLDVSPANLLHLVVLPNGLVEARRGESQSVQLMRADAIEGLWRQDVSENPNLIADVKTHPDTPYGFMVAVLEALHSADATRISLEVLEP